MCFPKKHIDKKSQKTPDHILSIAQFWAEFKGGIVQEITGAQPYIIDWSADAIQFRRDWVDVEYDLCIKDKTGCKSIYASIDEHAAKLALLHACSRDGGINDKIVVDMESVEWAYGLARYLAEYLIRAIGDYISDSPFHAACQKIKQVIMEHGEYTTYTAKDDQSITVEGWQISRSNLTRYQKALRPRELDEVLQSLYDAADIDKWKDQTSKTRKTEMYILVDRIN
jgi:hypothetical protein